MIKINLASRKQAVAAGGDARATSGGGGMDSRIAGALGGLKMDMRLDGLKELPLKRIAVSVLAAVAANFVVDGYKEDELQKWDGILGKAKAEQTRLTTDLAKTKGFDELKKSLDADELILRTKVDTIQKLLADRQVPPKMMMTLSSAIPTEVWLKGLKITDKEVTISGASSGFNQISDFMKNLNESAYFTDIKLQGTQQEHDELGAEVASFELRTGRR